MMEMMAKKPRAGQSFTLCLNFLDYTLLLLISLIIAWLYYRSSVGVNYQWHWQEAIALIFTPSKNGDWPYFFQGLATTIRLSLWGGFLALVLGCLLGLARFSKQAFFRIPATTYILLIRNIPPLVFVFIFYFFISNQIVPLLGLDTLLRGSHANVASWQAFLFGQARLWENLLSGVLCIGMLSAAYIAEIVRSGLSNIAKGQWEAAYSLGLSPLITYRKIIFPQVLAAITPALAGQSIALVKDSSIVSLISIQEMTFVGTEIANSSSYVFEIWLMVGLAYLLLCLCLSRLFSWIEKRHQRHFIN